MSAQKILELERYRDLAAAAAAALEIETLKLRTRLSWPRFAAKVPFLLATAWPRARHGLIRAMGRKATWAAL